MSFPGIKIWVPYKCSPPEGKILAIVIGSQNRLNIIKNHEFSVKTSKIGSRVLWVTPRGTKRKT